MNKKKATPILSSPIKHSINYDRVAALGVAP